MTFDYTTAAALAKGETVPQEQISQFVSRAREGYYDRESLSRMIEELHRTISTRESEIELLKTMLDADREVVAEFIYNTGRYSSSPKAIYFISPEARREIANAVLALPKD